MVNHSITGNAQLGTSCDGCVSPPGIGGDVTSVDDVAACGGNVVSGGHVARGDGVPLGGKEGLIVGLGGNVALGDSVPVGGEVGLIVGLNTNAEAEFDVGHPKPNTVTKSAILVEHPHMS